MRLDRTDFPYTPHRTRRLSAAGFVWLLYPFTVIRLTLAHIFYPQQAGLLALTQVFAAYLFLPLLLWVPFAFRRGAMTLRLVLFVCVLLFTARYLPPVNAASPGETPGATQVSVMSWNAYLGSPEPQELYAMLRRESADIVALQEAGWSWLRTDEVVAQLYPYTLNDPREMPPGMVLLSKYPVLDHGVLDEPDELWDIPRLMWARLDLGGGKTLVVVNAHPVRACTFATRCPFPTFYDPQHRDRQLRAIRGFVQQYIDRGESLLLAGDFNVTEREPAYNELSEGLIDSFLEVGKGAGHTWRHRLLMDRGIGLLRIDYLFAGPGIIPLVAGEDCSPTGSDHCMIRGRFEVR
jgi:vancomycin resistance protein VanJ